MWIFTLGVPSRAQCIAAGLAYTCRVFSRARGKDTSCLNSCEETNALPVTSVSCHGHCRCHHLTCKTLHAIPRLHLRSLYWVCLLKNGSYPRLLFSWSRGPGRARGTRRSALAGWWRVFAAAAERYDLTLLQPLHSGSAFLLSTPGLLQCWTFSVQNILETTIETSKCSLYSGLLQNVALLRFWRARLSATPSGHAFRPRHPRLTVAPFGHAFRPRLPTCHSDRGNMLGGRRPLTKHRTSKCVERCWPK